MSHRWRPVKSRLVLRLGMACVAGCSIWIIASLTTYAAPPAASRPQTQADHENGPVVMVGVPFDIISSHTFGLSGDGRMMIVPERHPANKKKEMARVWDIATLKPVTEMLRLGWLNYGLSFDGKVAFTTDPEHIWVWDVPTSKLLWTKELHQTQSDGVAISPDGTEIVAISEADKSIKVWRVGSDDPRLSIKQTAAAFSVDFDPTGKRIATICDNLLHIYDVETGHELFPGFDPYGIPEDLRHHFDSTGRRFLDLQDWGARVIDTATGKTLLRIESKHNIELARWSADSDKVVLVANSDAAQIYDAATGRLERTIVGDHMFNAWVLPGGRWAICQRYKKPLEVWDLTTGQNIQTLDVSEYATLYLAGSKLVTKDVYGVMKFWQLRADFR